MKIEIKFPASDWFELDENLAGVTTIETPHSGSLRVKAINSVTLTSSGDLLIICDPVEAIPEPLVVDVPSVGAVALTALDESGKPTEWPNDGATVNVTVNDEGPF
jgi:hypothetical protein